MEKKNKKIIKIFIVTFIIISIFLVLSYKYNIFNALKEKINKNEKEEVTETEVLTYSPVRITCGNDETATLGFGYSIYEGDELYCTFSIMTYIKEKIDEISFDYDFDNRFEYLDSYLIYGKTQWEIDYSIKKDEVKLNKTNNSFKFSFKDGFYKNLYNFYVIKFKSFDVDETGYFEPINIKNIVINSKNKKNYKFEEKTSANGHIIITDFSATKYNYKKNGKIIEFYKDGKKINSYECESEPESCYVGAYMGTDYIDLNNGRALLTDRNYNKDLSKYDKLKYLLFDFNKGIIKELNNLDGTLTKDNKSDEVKYILGSINNEQVIIDLDGNIIKNLKDYDKFEVMKGKMGYYSNVYSIDNNMIVLSKNGKKGITELTTNKVLLDFKYDDIRLFNKDYFKYKQNNLWYVANINTNSKINDIGYKNIFMIDNDIMVAQIDNYLYIKQFDGTNIIEDKLEVFYDYQEFISNPSEPHGIWVHKDYEDSNTINIYIDTKPTKEDKSDFKTLIYKYNINNKELTRTDN